MTPKGIVVHHSLTKDGKVSDFEGMRRYHMEEKGWTDIGYHFVIEQVGNEITTRIGRDPSEIGAHCVGKNNYIGICVVGNYDVGHDTLSRAHLAALVNLTLNLMLMYNLNVSSIHKHSEFAPKSCPGTGFPWSEYIQRVS
jgi:N-acetyl-anhydromuramyl-L-alanine amidase AmpD